MSNYSRLAPGEGDIPFSLQPLLRSSAITVFKNTAFARRYPRLASLLLVIIPGLALLSITVHVYKRYLAPPTLYINGVPRPDFQHIRDLEDSLPQHDISLPYPEGNNGR